MQGCKNGLNYLGPVTGRHPGDTDCMSPFVCTSTSSADVE